MPVCSSQRVRACLSHTATGTSSPRRRAVQSPSAATWLSSRLGMPGCSGTASDVQYPVASSRAPASVWPRVRESASCSGPPSRSSRARPAERVLRVTEPHAAGSWASAQANARRTGSAVAGVPACRSARAQRSVEVTGSSLPERSSWRQCSPIEPSAAWAATRKPTARPTAAWMRSRTCGSTPAAARRASVSPVSADDTLAAAPPSSASVAARRPTPVPKGDLPLGRRMSGSPGTPAMVPVPRLPPGRGGRTGSHRERGAPPAGGMGTAPRRPRMTRE